MKISCISDIHIRVENDKGHKVLESFINHPIVNESEEVYFLGDIFDFMVGGQVQYLNHYKFFFDLISKLIHKNIKVIYVEGNHDFHLEAVFKKFIQTYDLDSNYFYYSKDEVLKENRDGKYLFCHGDIVDDKNESFKKWKSIYRSYPFRTLVNNFIPYSIAKRLGRKASNDSKKRGSRTFDYKDAKQKYIEGASRLLETKENTILVAGHTHIVEDIKIGSNKYINNGFPIKDKKFIHLTNGTARLINLMESSE